MAKILLKNRIFIILFFLFTLNSCKVFVPNRMFEQGNYEYFQVDKKILYEYNIQKGDILSLEVFSREGFELIDVLNNGTNAKSNINPYSYLVEQDGFVELPLFGRINVLGYTSNELEDILELKAKAVFNNPFAILKVTNRKTFVFKGSTAQVVSLNESPTNLLEVIAKSGGIGDNLKAYNIKIIRGDLKNPEIILIDLSTIEGLRGAELTIQSNDVIYIEKRYRVASEVLSELTPVLSLATALTTIIVLVTNIKK